MSLATRGLLLRFHDHTQRDRHTTLGRTPPDEGSDRTRDLKLKTSNTHNRQTLMPPKGFEPTNEASERPQTHALERGATGIGQDLSEYYIKILSERRTAVARWLRCCATNRKVAASIPGSVSGFIIHTEKPSDRTTALGSTQPLSEMSTRSISWG